MAHNANPQDRTLSRDIVVPVRILMAILGNQWITFPSGELGISSFAFIQNQISYSSQQVRRFYPKFGQWKSRETEVDRVKDVHEITVDGDSIWVANTGTDEALEINAITNKLENKFP